MALWDRDGPTGAFSDPEHPTRSAFPPHRNEYIASEINRAEEFKKLLSVNLGNAGGPTVDIGQCNRTLIFSLVSLRPIRPLGSTTIARIDAGPLEATKA